MDRYPNGDRGLIFFCGDGTLERALEIKQKRNHPAPVGGLPGGGQNLFVKSIGVDADYKVAAEQYGGRTVVEQATVADVNGNICLVGTLFGEGTVRIFEGIEAMRDKVTPESLGMIFDAVAKAALFGESLQLDVSADGGRAQRHEGTIAVVTNNLFKPRRPGSAVMANPLGNFKALFAAMSAKESIDSGKVGFYAFHGSVFDTLSLHGAISKGTWTKHRSISSLPHGATTLEIMPADPQLAKAPVRSIIDGEEKPLEWPVRVTQGVSIPVMRPRK